MKNLSIPNWQFYYETNENVEVIVEDKQCKQPSRTSNWKMLKKLLNDNDVKTIGYRLFSSSGNSILIISES